MRDPFGRIIDYLRLSITDRCNLRCRYCMPEEGVHPLRHGDILSYEEMLRVARIAIGLGVRKIRVTGGEPLVRKGVVDFIRQLAQLPGSPEVTMTTNGLLLADYAAELKKAGLSRINVSLDTLRPERFAAITRREGLPQVFAGLEAAEKYGLTPLKINMVPIAGVNADEVIDFARLTVDRSWEVRFIEFMPVSANLEYTANHRFSADSIMAEMRRAGLLVPIPRSGPSGVARLYHFEKSRGQIGVIPAVSQHFCGECNRLRITSEGQLRPCLFSTKELDLRALLRCGAKDDDLRSLVLAAIGAKPEKHRLNELGFQHTGRHMQGIGG